MTDASIAAQVRAADLAKVRRARAMSPFEKFDAGASLFEEACAWNLAGIAHQHPEWDATTRQKKTPPKAQTRESSSLMNGTDALITWAKMLTTAPGSTGVKMSRSCPV